MKLASKENLEFLIQKKQKVLIVRYITATHKLFSLVYVLYIQEWTDRCKSRPISVEMT
jgi:hypothetical protein